MASMVMGQMGPAAGMMMGGPPPTDPSATFGDPVLAQLEANPPPLPPFDPLAGLSDHQMPGYMPKMDHGTWQEIANIDQEHYTDLVKRFSRDLAL
jgi:hypothetical protein